jgi:hypothetical protein
MAAGMGELGATVVQSLQRQITDPRAGIEAVLPKVSASMASMFDQWFPFEKFQVQPLNPEEAVRPEVGCILAGYPSVGKPRDRDAEIYSLVSPLNFAPLLHDYGFAVSGVAQYALYLMNRIYRNDIVLDNAIALAHYVIAETASQDGKVGGPVRIAVIDPDRGFQELPTERVKELQDRDRKVNEAIAKLFRLPT